jgi:hypothetical protein
MNTPSTTWRETIPADEESRHAKSAALIAAMQGKYSSKYGAGRALHRKPVASMRGTLEVLPNLPAAAQFGMFAESKKYDVWARLSNGGPEIKANTRPDIRGFALRILNVHGDGALGAPTDHQDFLMINHDQFASRTSDEFAGIVAAAAKSPFEVLKFMIATHGWLRSAAQVKIFTTTFLKPFSSFATEPFNTVLPHAVGPYAARVGVLPLQSGDRTARDIGADINGRLAADGVAYDLTLQFFVDESQTPIEDPTVVWDPINLPPVVVGRLTFPRQSIDLEFGKQIELAKFDPWAGLAAHRPLGEIMRARKAAYFASQQARGV